MKSVLGVFLFSIVIVSCSKQASAPQTPAGNVPSIFYRDNNIAVADMKATETDKSNVAISFSTLYENAISKIEIMSGNSTSTLCTIYVTNIKGSSEKTKNYTFNDDHLKGSTMYYMIRYTSEKGDWGYTPLITVKVQ